MIIDITDGEFEQKVIQSKDPVLVELWAQWCVPCRKVAPVVEKLSHKYDGRCRFYKMNIAENPKTPGRYSVMSIPTLLLFKSGAAVDTVVGAVSERSLASRIDGIL
jgi:thioredoxin 1